MNNFIPALLIALVALGAIISLSNERARNSIERVNKTARLWAESDLRLKRGSAVKTIEIKDVTIWIQRATWRALSVSDVELTHIETHQNEPAALVYQDIATGERLIYSPHSPSELRAIQKAFKSQNNKLDINMNPLLTKLPRKTIREAVELTLLTAGVLFDLELQVAWEKIMHTTTNAEVLWLYKLE